MPQNLTELGEAARSLHRNEGLAGIYPICDGEIAEAAVIEEPEKYTDTVGLLDTNKLPDEFLPALRVIHNASYPERIAHMSDQARWPVTQRGASEFHRDNWTSPVSLREALVSVFPIRGSAWLGLMRLEPSQMENGRDTFPNKIKSQLSRDPGVDCTHREGYYVPKALFEELGIVIETQPGTLTFFSGAYDLAADPPRREILHQAVSLANDPEERNRRRFSVIDSDIMRSNAVFEPHLHGLKRVLAGFHPSH